MSYVSHAETMKMRLRPFGIVFEKSLHDLIEGLRKNKEPELKANFIQGVLDECRKEVKSSNMDLKSTSILKLCYLEMYGFDMSWASFNVIEVMSATNFQHKRVGYFAACQVFRVQDDVLMLATNLLKKDLASASQMDAGLALNVISTIVTPSLAKDILDDIVRMLNHSKPYIRKKAVLALYKVYLQYPESLADTIDQVVTKLDDEDESVMTATVTVICELVKKTPKTFIEFAPKLYDIMDQVEKNNWVLIRFLKLFSSLALFESRLKLRLVPKIKEILDSQNALSLIYECVNCIITGKMLESDDFELAYTCTSTLRLFYYSGDSNLKFVGLEMLSKIALIEPEFIKNESKFVIYLLKEGDLSIRRKCLDVLEYVINEENLEEAVDKLVTQLTNYPATTDYNSIKIKTINTILKCCTQSNYANIANFDWFVSMLYDLCKISSESNLQVSNIGIEFRNVLVKIPSMRGAVLNNCIIPLLQDQLVLDNLAGCLNEIIWGLGEYSSLLQNCDKALIHLVERFENLVEEEDSRNEETLLVLIPCLVKMLNSHFNSREYMWGYNEKMKCFELLKLLIKFFKKLSISRNFNIQERAVEYLEFLKILQESIKSTEDDSLQLPMLLSTVLPALFDSWVLNPISKGAQLNVPVPNTLDLDLEIYPLATTYTGVDSYLNFRNNINDYDDDEDDDDDNNDKGSISSSDEYEYNDSDDIGSEFRLYLENLANKEQHSYHDNEPFMDVEKQRAQRLQMQEENPFYLTETPPATKLRSQMLSNKLPVSENDTNNNIKKLKPHVILEEKLVGSTSGNSSRTNAFNTSIVSSKLQQRKKKNILKLNSNSFENFNKNKNTHAPPFLRYSDKAEPVPSLENGIYPSSTSNEVVVVSKKIKKKSSSSTKKKSKSDKAGESGEPKSTKKKKKKKRTIIADESVGST